MIEQIENIETLMDSKPCQIVLDGLESINLCINISANGNIDLINELDNGRRK